MLSIPAAAQETLLPGLLVTATRLGPGAPGASYGITGASTSVITAEEIERSPSATLTDILGRQPGIQVQNLFGAVNGARSTVDMRGFGATAANNTLVLINGRRLNDLDLQGVDLSAIPLASIERVEITRGNSGAVVYGEGAIGGVINIITKTGAGVPPSARIEAGFGSFQHREVSGSASGSSGPWSASVFGNSVATDGYRDNNEYRQSNGVADIRYAFDQGSVYFNVTIDDQHLGLPAHRRVEPSLGINQLVTDRRGATTPFDFADKQGVSATLGVARMLAPGAELIVDGGVRRKNQQAGFFGSFANPASTDPLRFVDTDLTTYSVTPRVRLDMVTLGLPWRAIGGVDYYKADYASDRSLAQGNAPIHRYDLSQDSVAAYWQHTATVHPTTDISVGGRIQRTTITAGDVFDPAAPGAIPVQCFGGFCFGDLAGTPLDKSETNRAYHIGIEQRLGPHVTLFGRHARSFRVPNVDERIGVVPSLSAIPTTFDLRTQTSRDIEGGVRVNYGSADLQWSIYDMNLENEIHFSPATFTNVNLDPTRRYGHETIASWRASDVLQLKAGYAFTRAVFREGAFAGNDVPLVSRHTANFGATWNIVDKRLVFDGLVRYVGARRMDNDQVNLQPLIPAHTVVDVRLGGEYKWFNWSVAVLNLFDNKYFDYAIASPFPFGFLSAIGTFNAYPQPGRSFLVKAGAKF